MFGGMSATDIVPAHLMHLLEAPNYAFLGTIRPDDTVQVNPMWFDFDGENLRFTHTTYRAKYRNLQHNPSMSLAILNDENAFNYIEVRGKLVEVVRTRPATSTCTWASGTATPSSSRPRTAPTASSW